MARFILFASLLLTLLLPTLARAATRNVPAEYQTIQAGVDAAEDGDTVLVADGLYTGPGNRDIDFGGKNLTVMSQHGPNQTRIDCGGYASSDGSGNHRGFYLHRREQNAVIDGFTIQNGFMAALPNTPDSGAGGGICIVDSGTAVRNCILSNNTADSGGGGYSETGSVTVLWTGCTVAGNTAREVGGGFNNVGFGGAIIVANCLVSGNTS